MHIMGPSGNMYSILLYDKIFKKYLQKDGNLFNLANPVKLDFTENAT